MAVTWKKLAFESEVVLKADTDVSANGWVIDEDNMVSDDATKVPTQQSVKAYVDAQILILFNKAAALGSM